MKKYLNWMLVMIFTISFTSCSKDDDNVPASNSNNVNWDSPTDKDTTTPSIIGSWIYSDEDGYDIVTFNPNGTGRWRFVEYNHPDLNDDEVFTYVYNNGVVTAIFGDEVESFTAVFIGDKLVLDGDIYTTYTGNIPNGGDTNETKLVGNWKYVWGDDGSYSIMCFKSNGTGFYTEIDYSSESYTDNFTYKYNAPLLILYWTDDKEEERITISFISDNKFRAEIIGEDGANEIWTRY
ncbi:MAG: hypothetical protein J6K41_06990 [Paraprevotella sp.]|nr:hypothetical protein [Paraprevotella sp.]